MPAPARLRSAARAVRLGRATPPDDTRGCRTPPARGAAWRCEPPAPFRPRARRPLPAGREHRRAGLCGSFRVQGIALADRVSRVHMHWLGERLESGVLEADRVATGLHG